MSVALVDNPIEATWRVPSELAASAQAGYQMSLCGWIPSEVDDGGCGQLLVLQSTTRDEAAAGTTTGNRTSPAHS